jgi:argininosuccinate lyase
VHEDAHTAVEDWLTRRHGVSGEQLHTGRSRNDQVAVDVRLFLKEMLLELHALGTDLAAALAGFAAQHATVLWPGYTHTRRAMPSSVGLWAAAYGESLMDTLESLPALWARVDRCPLGSAAGYGVPLALNREATARALGFGAVEHNVAAVQLGRGKLEAAVLAWCGELGQDLGRLSADVILFSAEEYGYLTLPVSLATGSSIMPHKRNPDLFELTRARAASVAGDHAAALHLARGLPGGYHQDFHSSRKAFAATRRRMLEMMIVAVPRSGRRRCCAAIHRTPATDEDAACRGGHAVPPRLPEVADGSRAARCSRRLRSGRSWPADRPADSAISAWRICGPGSGRPGREPGSAVGRVRAPPPAILP